jgi:hypothetical protein
VADAGTTGGLRPLVAFGALLAIILSLALSISNAERNDLQSKLPMNTPPGELTSQALQTLADVGVAEPGLHRRFGFNRYWDYLSWLNDQDPAVDLAVLKSGSPPGARFWFRYSAAEMQPDNLDAFFVSMGDPGQDEPGQGRIWLDLEGRLLGLDLVPDRIIDADGESVDWSVLFAAAGFDTAAFAAIEPVRAPSAPCDELRAWRGPVYQGVEGIVQAGRMGGAPVYFEILGPWDLAEDDDGSGSSVAAVEMIFGLVMSLILLTVFFLARRNWMAGRSDFNGAFKLAAFLVVSVCSVWIMAEVRLDTLAVGSLFQQLVLGRLVAHGLAYGALAGLMYIALEPYVRRLWPETLVSWSRLLMGRVRDPLVGRDLLVGMAVIGFLTAVLTWLYGLIAQSLGIPEPMPWSPLIGLSGLRYAVADIAIDSFYAMNQAMIILVCLLVFRLVLRRNWAAILAFHLLITAMVISSPQFDGLPTWLFILSIVGNNLVVAVLIGCLLRLGLLSLIGGLFMMLVMRNAILTWDFQQWYAGSTLVTLIAVLALAVWSFYISLAGRQLFKDSVLD